MRRRRLVSYPFSLAVVVAALIAFTGGWIAWWNYRAGLANIRAWRRPLFDQIAAQSVQRHRAFLQRASPAADTLAGLESRRIRRICQRAARATVRGRVAGESGLHVGISYSDAAGAFTGAFRSPAAGCA